MFFQYSNFSEVCKILSSIIYSINTNFLGCKKITGRNIMANTIIMAPIIDTALSNPYYSFKNPLKRGPHNSPK